MVNILIKINTLRKFFTYYLHLMLHWQMTEMIRRSERERDGKRINKQMRIEKRKKRALVGSAFRFQWQLSYVCTLFYIYFLFLNKTNIIYSNKKFLLND